jgi:hypothetical protein
MRNSPIEGSITFYGMTIQQSLVNLGHVFHKFPCMGEIIFFKSTIWQKFGGGRIPCETNLLQGIRVTKQRPSSCIIPFKSIWFSERK